MSDREQAQQMSQSVAEVERLKNEIRLALRDFDGSNAHAAISRLRGLVEPKPMVHILVFPATAPTLRSVCGERKFSDKDLLVPSKDSVDPEIQRTHDNCQKCFAQRTVP